MEWRRVGAVWAADFKERREPLEGRYGRLLSIKDLGSGISWIFAPRTSLAIRVWPTNAGLPLVALGALTARGEELAWEPLIEATATVVQDIYARLFEEHGPPLVLKSDNGGQFKADETKALLAAYRVLPLYSPKRHPQYNGAVERANGQVTSYQQALAEYHQRPAGPTCDDAEAARLLANDQAHPQGWRGPTARELWEQHPPMTPDERAAFLDSVEVRRGVARAAWNFADEVALTHYEAAAVDRRAIRDALVAHDLLVIHPCRKRKREAEKVSGTFF